MPKRRDGRTTDALQAGEGIRQIPLAALRQHEDNPRRISGERLDQLKATLTADPAMLEARPLIALPDGRVIAGNQRLRAAGELGWETIATVVVDLDEGQARLWMLRDNNAFGDWDERPLAEMLASLAEGGVELALAGFDTAELDALLAGLEAERARPDPDDAPPVPAKPRSKLGEVYKLGPHRLMCGDATDQAHVEELMRGATVEAIVTDPPYGIGREGIANDDEAGLRTLFDSTLAAAPLAPSAVVAAFQSPRLVVHWLDATRAAGHTFERLLWLHRPTAKTYPWRGWVLASDAIAVSSVGKPRWPEPDSFCHDTYVKTELEDESLTGLHTTIKPRWIVRDLIAKLPRSDVYEPVAGSGTTLIAADQLGRRAFLMEIDPAYCDVIRDRWAAWTADG